MERTPLLIVEDEVGIAESLRFVLEREPFLVEHASSLAAARARLGAQPSVTVMILDLGLPDGSGVDLLRELRSQGVEMPIIVLTSRSDEVDRIVGLELGADDYVSKPFSPREMVARVKAVLRRTRSRGDGRSEATGRPPSIGLNLDASRRRLWWGAVEVSLTRLEFDLLALLASRPGHVFTREVVLDRLWPEATVSDRTVDAHVKSLRQSLRSAGNEDELIETVRGVGYRMRE